MFRNPKRVRRWTAIAVAIGLFCSVDAMAKKPSKPPGGGETAPYTFVDLQGLPGARFLQSDARALSEPDGDGAIFVVGDSLGADGFSAAAWSVDADGTFFGPLDLGVPSLGRKVDVNDAGVAVTHTGQVFVPGMAMQQLTATDAVDIHARAINNNDQIVGWVVYDDGTTREGRGVLWQLEEGYVPTDPIILDPAGTSSFFPMDISDTGIMAGDMVDDGIAAIARLEGGNLQIDLLGTLQGFGASDADAISSNGKWVAGTCRRSHGPTQAYRCYVETGEMTGLVGLAGAERNSFAYDVNSAGQVVGNSDTGGGRYSMAGVLWDNGQPVELNGLAGAGSKIHIDIGKGINDAGYIAGLMRISRPVSEAHGFVMIPITQ